MFGVALKMNKAHRSLRCSRPNLARSATDAFHSGTKRETEPLALGATLGRLSVARFDKKPRHVD